MREKSLLLILCYYCVLERTKKALNIILSNTLLCYYGVNVGGVMCNSFGIAVGHMTNVSGCLTEIITIIIITFFFIAIHVRTIAGS